MDSSRMRLDLLDRDRSVSARCGALLIAVMACGLGPPGVTAAEEPLRNADVVKMQRADLGDDLIIAKIWEAPRVELALGVDDLVALRSEGLSQDVIKAMLDRNAGSASPARRSDPQVTVAPERQHPMHSASGSTPALGIPGIETIGVELVAAGAGSRSGSCVVSSARPASPRFGSATSTTRVCVPEPARWIRRRVCS